MSQPKEIFVRLDRCMGCHSCELACAVAHSAGQSLIWRPVRNARPEAARLCRMGGAGHRPCPSSAATARMRPACTPASPEPSAAPPAVWCATDRDKCIGCWTCVMVCPYGVIGRHLEEHKAYRCDRCPDREMPACVSSLSHQGAGLSEASSRVFPQPAPDRLPECWPDKGDKCHGTQTLRHRRRQCRRHGRSRDHQEVDPHGSVRVLERRGRCPLFPADDPLSDQPEEERRQICSCRAGGPIRRKGIEVRLAPGQSGSTARPVS